jgi:hypothetical protein
MRIRSLLIASSWALLVACSQSDTSSPAGPGVDAGGAGQARIDSVNTMSAAPMSLVEISGAGFAASGTSWVRFLDARGYALAAPAVQATPTRVVAAVPPYVDLTSGAIGRATVELDVSADPKEKVRASNSLQGMQILDLAAARSPAGNVTSAFLRASVGFGRQLQTELEVSALNTPGLRAALARQIDDLSNLQARVDAIVNDPTRRSSLGTVHGVDVELTADQLRIVDGLIVGMLLAQANPTALPYGPFDVGCMQSEAAAAAQAAQDSNAALDPMIANLMNARSTAACQAADAFSSGFQVVGAAGGVALGIMALAGAPAAALALGGAGVLYVTVVGAGGMIALGGALGSSTAGARQLVVQGVNAIEDKLRGAAVGFVLPDTVGTLKDLLQDSMDLYDQLSSSSSGTSTSGTSTTGTGSSTMSSGTGSGAGGAGGSSTTATGGSGGVAGSSGAGGTADGGSSLCCCTFMSEHYCANCVGCPQGLCIGGQCLSPCWDCVMASAPINGWLCGATCNAPPADRCDVACP